MLYSIFRKCSVICYFYFWYQNTYKSSVFNYKIVFSIFVDPPVIIDIPDYNITEGSILHINPTIDANPHPIAVWWTRQNDTSYIYNGMNLTISNIQRDYGDYYKCNAMNTINIPSQPTQNKTTEMLFKVNVQCKYNSLITHKNLYFNIWNIILFKYRFWFDRQPYSRTEILWKNFVIVIWIKHFKFRMPLSLGGG